MGSTELLHFSEESPGDEAAIHQVVADAFGRPNEADLVQALRSHGGLVFSAVAKRNGEIIGHAGFSPLTIGGVSGDPPVLALAPVAVAASHQRQGHGTALLRWSLDQLRQAGCPGVIVLGEPEFYGRVGFRPASEFGIVCPFAGAEKYFLVQELKRDGLKGCAGPVEYRPEFATVE